MDPVLDETTQEYFAYRREIEAQQLTDMAAVKNPELTSRDLILDNDFSLATIPIDEEPKSEMVVGKMSMMDLLHELEGGTSDSVNSKMDIFE